jgi:hypothetical protein
MSNEFKTHLMDFHDFPNDPFYMNRVREFEEVRGLLKNLGRPPIEKLPKESIGNFLKLWTAYINLLRTTSSICKPYFLDYQEYNRRN